MTRRYCTGITVLYVPTGEIRLYDDTYTTRSESLARASIFLSHLRNMVGPQFQSHPWRHLPAEDDDDDGIEDVIECCFRWGPQDEVRGTVVVAAVQDDDESEFGMEEVD